MPSVKALLHDLLDDLNVRNSNPFLHPVRVIARQAVVERNVGSTREELEEILAGNESRPIDKNFDYYLSMFDATVRVALNVLAHQNDIPRRQMKHEPKQKSEWLEEIDRD